MARRGVVLVVCVFYICLLSYGASTKHFLVETEDYPVGYKEAAKHILSEELSSKDKHTFDELPNKHKNTVIHKLDTMLRNDQNEMDGNDYDLDHIMSMISQMTRDLTDGVKGEDGDGAVDGREGVNEIANGNQSYSQEM